MTFTKYTLPRLMSSKMTDQYNAYLKKRFNHMQITQYTSITNYQSKMKTTGKILLGKVTNTTMGRISFNPAQLNSAIDRTKTLSITFDEDEWTNPETKKKLPFSTLYYYNGNNIKQYICDIEFDNEDMRMDLIPLFSISVKNELFLEILYLEGVLKYYGTSSGQRQFFSNDVQTDLPLLHSTIIPLLSGNDEKKPISILDEKEMQWYGKYSNLNSNVMPAQIDLLIGAIDYNNDTGVQGSSNYIFGDMDVEQYGLDKRIGGVDINISATGEHPIVIKNTSNSVVFQANLNVSASGVTISGGNLSYDSLFYYVKISGILSNFRGISIATGESDSRFTKLKNRITFINRLLGNTI